MAKTISLDLRGKFLAFFLVFALIPFLIVVYSGITRFDQTITARELENGRNLTASLGKYVMKTLHDVTEATLLLSESLGKTSGDEAKSTILREFIERNPLFSSASFANSQGVQVADSHGNNLGEDKSQTEWFQASAKEGKTYLSDIRKSIDLGAYVINCSTPVYDQEGQLQGVVTTRLDLEKFYQNIAEDIHILKTGYPYLYDAAKKMIILHPDQNLVGKSLAAVESSLQQIDEKLTKNKEGVLRYSFQGVERIVFFQTLKPYGHFSEVNFKEWRIAAVAPLAELREPVVKMIRLILILAAVTVVAVVLFSLQIASSLALPIRKVAQALQKASQGDLRITFEERRSQDEVGLLVNSFQSMVKNFHELVGNTLSVSTQLATASEELSAAVEEVSAITQEIAKTMTQVAEGSNRQGEELQTLSLHIEGIAKMAQNVRQKTKENLEHLNTTMKNSLEVNTQALLRIRGEIDKATQTGEEAGKETLRGQELLQMLMNGITAISQATQGVAQSIATLEERSQEISKIVDVISGFAEQTNLLALNAAIEAARAGEAGRGFAVVAEEVRKLAEGSAQAAQQIASLINEIQQDTQMVVKNMESAQGEVQAGVEKGEIVAQSFDQILQSIQKVIENIAQIASSAYILDQAQKELSRVQEENTTVTTQVAEAVEQITTSINEITEKAASIAAVAEENAASSEEVSASTEEQSASLEEITSATSSLAKLAEELQKTVSVFQI